MPVSSLSLRSDGSVAQAADGSVILIDPADSNCAHCPCAVGTCESIVWNPYVQAGTGKAGGDLIRFAYDGEATGQPWQKWKVAGLPHKRVGPNLRRCHRLLIYEGVTIASNALTGGVGVNTPTYIIMTNGRGYRPGVLPFETTKGSGIPLDTQPYWYSACAGVGGWQDVTATHWHKPTLTLMDGRRSTALGNGTYTYVILAAYISWKFKNGTHAILPTHGSVQFKGWHAILTA